MSSMSSDRFDHNASDENYSNGDDYFPRNDSSSSNNNNDTNRGQRSGGRNNNNNKSNNEFEIATRKLEIMNKRLYLDLKQNNRGRYVKFTEIIPSGRRKLRILFGMSAAAKLRDFLPAFIAHVQLSSNNGERNNLETSGTAEDRALKTETMSDEKRFYYLDLKENNRGRYLRITQLIRPPPFASDNRRHSNRTQIAIPAQNIDELHDALTELLELSQSEPQQQGSSQSSPPTTNEKKGGDVGNSTATGAQQKNRTSSRFRTGRREFYFDVGENQFGVYMRITKKFDYDHRTVLTVPQKAWSQFIESFNHTTNSWRRSSSDKQQQPNSRPTNQHQGGSDHTD